MEHQLTYTIKVWLTAAGLAPVLYLGFTGEFGKSIEDIFFMMIMLPLIGTIFSFPSAVLLWFVTYLMCRFTKLNAILLRAIWSLIGIVLSIMPFLFFGPVKMFMREFGPLPWMYASIIVLGIWIYRFKPKIAKSDEDERLLYSAINP